RHPTNPGIQIRRSLPVSQVRFLPGGVKKPSRRLGKAKRHPTNPGIQIRRSHLERSLLSLMLNKPVFCLGKRGSPSR
ncbi:MAG: hypothetical protein P5694_09615, partial [Limnospira sp. PMC 1286.21]|uniref:hypothetical protein n=1 Tax=unclassified Limnospira TaxID=2642885 RepID=UPI0028E0BAEA